MSEGRRYVPHLPSVTRSGDERPHGSAILYGQYHVALVNDGPAASLCGESDIDDNGIRAVFVVFFPAPGGAPAAPCSEPVDWSPEYESGAVIQMTDPTVF